jgi:hypothetical protein
VWHFDLWSTLTILAQDSKHKMLLTAYFETTYRFLRDHLEYGLARREKNDEDTFNKDLNTYTYQKHVVKFL